MYIVINDFERYESPQIERFESLEAAQSRFAELRATLSGASCWMHATVTLGTVIAEATAGHERMSAAVDQ